ncbi:MAG: MBL fold metallo-hydrolase [Elusimicrobia bacterium]|nr:MBL fold metallo-hydrolase [Elusimicrobiota bacterium]
MKSFIIFLFAASFLSLSQLSAEEKEKPKDIKIFAEQNIIWHGQSAFEIHDDLTIFTDPYKLKKAGKADIILITHPHPDHLSSEDIGKIQSTGTVIVAPDDPECREKLSGDVKFVKPGDTLTVKGVLIEVVPAYNIGTRLFHLKSSNWAGYIFEIDGIRIYTAGDTDRIPEMKQINTDIALLPIGGFFTMDAKEASQAALDINPSIVIPMHYGARVGSAKDAEKFRQLLENKLDVLIKTAE